MYFWCWMRGEGDAHLVTCRVGGVQLSKKGGGYMSKKCRKERGGYSPPFYPPTFLLKKTILKSILKHLIKNFFHKNDKILLSTKKLKV